MLGVSSVSELSSQRACLPQPNWKTLFSTCRHGMPASCAACRNRNELMPLGARSPNVRCNAGNLSYADWTEAPLTAKLKVCTAHSSTIQVSLGCWLMAGSASVSDSALAKRMTSTSLNAGMPPVRSISSVRCASRANTRCPCTAAAMPAAP
jgi:hypothetical protein